MTHEEPERETLISAGCSSTITPPSVQGPEKLHHASDTAETALEEPLEVAKRPLFLFEIWAWAQRRITLLLMVSFIVVALWTAIGHGLLFMYLNGKTTDNWHIQQAYITNISLLFVTIFKSCIVTAVGIAFTQHLWNVLRRRTLAIGRIEQLFSIRSNPTQLTKLRLVSNAPMLFLMGLFIWLVPIALIYPPSALTVRSLPFILTEDAEVAILFPPTPSINPTTKYFTVPRLSHSAWFFEESQRRVYTYYDKASYLLLGITRTVLLSGDIPTIQAPNRENASYLLEIPGYRMACKSSLADITEDLAFTGFGAGDNIIGFESDWNDLRNDRNPRLIIRNLGHLRALGSEHEYNVFSRWDPKVEYEGQYEIIECRPVSSVYTVEISYERSQRRIKYTTRDHPEPKTNYTENYFPIQSELTSWERDSTNKTVDFPPAFREIFQRWEKWAILDASLEVLRYSCRFSGSGELLYESTSTGKFWWQWKVSDSYCDNVDRDSANQWPLDLSTFNSQRSNETARSRISPKDFKINEQTINDFIANVTISALSLNLGKAKVPVKYTEYRTTYHFSRPVNVILPYSLILFLSVGFVVIGILSLNRNGVAATDGGFLQLMTSSIGRTKLEELVIEYYNTHDGDRVPKALLDLNIRYGELIDEEGVGTGIAAFGTEEETRTLQKIKHLM